MQRDERIAQAKRALRRATWTALRAARVTRFPGAVGRIPNFVGAEAAAEALSAEAVWRRARVLLCNPDLPQRPVRYRALRHGKRLYVAVPRLEAPRPFVVVDPRRLAPSELWEASSIPGMLAIGRALGVAHLAAIDLCVVGCVAVARDGARLGKGGGYDDLGYALLREAGKLTARTPIVTSVHPLQVKRRGRIPMMPHDVSVDWYATPSAVLRCPRKHRRPRGVREDSLSEATRRDVPALARRRRARR